jgi:hypothetical protein
MTEATAVLEEIKTAQIQYGQQDAIDYARQFGLLSAFEFRDLVDASRGGTSETKIDLDRLRHRVDEVLVNYGIHSDLRWGYGPWHPDNAYVFLAPNLFRHDMRRTWRITLERLRTSETGADPRYPLPIMCPDQVGLTDEECARRLVYMRLPRLFRHLHETSGRSGTMPDGRFVQYSPAEQGSLFGPDDNDE